MRFFPALYVNRLKGNTIFFRCLFQNRYILCIERTLACVIQDISFLIYTWMLSTFFKLRYICFLIKRQIPELYTIISFITYNKALVLQELRICQKRFFLCSAQYTKTLLPFFLTILDAFSKQICRITMAFKRSGHPQAVNIHIPVCLNRDPCIFRRDIFYKALSALHTL